MSVEDNEAVALSEQDKAPNINPFMLHVVSIGLLLFSPKIPPPFCKIPAYFIFFFAQVQKLIINMVPVSELRTCRLISKGWESLANSRLQKHLKPLKFHNVRSSHVLRFTQGAPNPVGKLRWPEVDIRRILIKPETEDEQIFYNFLYYISPWIENLRLYYDTIPTDIHVINEIPEYYKFSCLTQIKFMADGWYMNTTVEANFQLLSLILRNAPNLQAVSLKSDKNPEIVTRFLQCLQDTNPRNLNSLELFGIIRDEHLDSLTSMGVVLKELILFIQCTRRITTLDNFLQNQASSLQKLGIFCVGHTDWSVQLPPIMQNLESLSTQRTNLFQLRPDANFGEQFPKLKHLAFRDKATLILFMEMSRSQLTTSFRIGIENVELPPDLAIYKKEIQWANDLFPNISSLSIPMRVGTALIACQLMEHLKELTLVAPEDYGIVTLEAVANQRPRQTPMLDEKSKQFLFTFWYEKKTGKLSFVFVLISELKLLTVVKEKAVDEITRHKDLSHYQVLEMITNTLSDMVTRRKKLLPPLIL